MTSSDLPAPGGAPARTPSAIDAVADAHVHTLAALDPLAATAMGLDGHDERMTDLSPAGHEARAAAARDTLTALSVLEPVDDVDVVTLAALRERLTIEVELHEAGETLRDLNVIASPVQGLREVFDLMPTDTVEHWEAIAARLSLLPWAVEGYAASLREAAAGGRVAPVRQVEECIRQAQELAAPESSFFGELVRNARPDGAEPPTALAAALAAGADAARAAYADLADLLSDELAPLAPAADAAGRERYSLWSRAFLGATVDLEETYAWGLEELARIVAEQRALAVRIAGPGADVPDAVAVLDADPDRRLHGPDALREWMQRTSDEAIEALDGRHFDIPGPLRRLECRIAPTQDGGIYYTGPSDDLSRPGRMWWSVPAGVDSFSTWRERTTVYHEGVPGHHLQVGQAVWRRSELNLWRRLACWVSGHGEGWALYAEGLMAELGHLDDPGDRLGLLDAQRLRAARVVLDIGVHLGLPVPAQWGEGTWDAVSAWRFLTANAALPEPFLQFELKRYLGWPGQAPSYAVGRRLWEAAREDARAAAVARGEAFDLKAFHARALDLGSVGLDVLRQALSADGLRG